MKAALPSSSPGSNLPLLQHSSKQPDAHPWLIVALLLVSVCINYIDRGSLSVAAPVLQQEFSISDKRLGYLLAAFFWSYTACQLFVGWLVDRYPVGRVYAGGFLLWSLAMAAAGTANTFWTFFGMRLLLGVGESVFLPSTSRIMVQLFPPERRGLPNAVVDVGTKIGPALSLMIGGFLITQFGWRWLFVAIGLISLLWLVPWFYLMPRGRAGSALPAAARPTAIGAHRTARPASNFVEPDRPSGASMLDLLRRKEVWGTSIGMFALGYVWVFLLTWLPEYLVKQRGYTMKEMSLFGSLPYWGMALASLGGGCLADVWIESGRSATFVRKTIALGGLVLCAALLVPAGMVSNSKLAMALLIGACIALGLFTSNVWAITQTLAGQTAAGKWTGIQNFIGNLGGVVSPIVAGLIVEKTGSFIAVFALAASVALAGAAVYGMTVGNVQELQFNRRLRQANGDVREFGDRPGV